MSKYSWAKYLLYDLKACARYPPTMRYGDTQATKKTKEEYALELETLKEAHPQTPAEDIENGVYTHTLMTGGKFLFNDEPVPDHILLPKALADLHAGLREAAPRLLGRPETYDDLFWLSLAHVQSHKRAWELDACLTEAVSKPYHHFFVDLDLLFHHPHESPAAWTDFVKKLCMSVGQGVLSCFPAVAAHGDPLGRFDFTVLVTKGYRPKTVGDRTVYKRGIHLVWPSLVVDKARSQTLARVIDEVLTKDMPRNRQAGENSWKDALDLSVYSSGLRPAGSPKISPCPQCRGVAKKRVAPGLTHDNSYRHVDFAMCHPPFGFVSQGDESVYVMEYIARGDGVLLSKKRLKERVETHQLKDDVLDRTFDFSLKRLTSIRSTQAEMTDGFHSPSHLRTPVLLEAAEYRVHPRQDPESGDYLPAPKRTRTLRGNSFELLVSTESTHFLTRIVQSFHPRYTGLIVDRVWAFPTEDSRKMLPAREKESPKRTMYSHLWIHVKGDNSHYCHLKPGEHGSSTIRFSLHYDGTITQGCWSHKVGITGRACCRSNTKGMPGFIDKVTPADYGFLADLFQRSVP